MIEKPQATLSVAARDMLVRLGSDAVDPLIAVLQSGSGDQQRIAANLLAILKPERALAPLVVALASQPAAAENSEALNAAIEQVAGRPLEPAEQIQFLENEALRQHKLAKVLENQDNYGAAPPSVIDWQWNPDSRELTRGIILEPALARSRAKRAIDAVAASVGTSRPLSPATRQLRWLILLNEAKHRLGFDQPLTPADVPLDEISLDELNELLKYALDRQELTAALGVVELMGQIGSPRLLLAADGKPTPLAQAARHGNRRLRFAALKAIVAIKPTEPFAGASAVGEGLAYFAKTLGMRRALVVDPRSEAAQQVASHLSGLGYDTEIATNGRKGFELATGSADFELAILHMAIDRPRIDDLLLQLRKDARTAEMPIGLVAVPGRETTADRLARGYDLVYPMAEALDAAATKHYVERLLQQPGAQSVDAETRLAQAAWATQTIADLIEQRVKWVDARAIARSLEVGILAALPDLREPTITLLGNTPDERSQVELARIVQLETLPAVTREAAALALARNITGHGVQLPRSVLLGLYRRYNENAGRNADTHKMLSIVLDAIETEKAQVADEAGTNIAPIKPPSPAASN
jgi:CheY-like chemotaxis protein